jgi:hypothetical protein
MPPPMTIAEMAIAIGLSAPLNFMIPRFKSDMTVFSHNCSLIVALPSPDYGHSSLQLLIFLTIELLQFHAGNGIRARHREFLKKTYKKHLTNSEK